MLKDENIEITSLHVEILKVPKPFVDSMRNTTTSESLILDVYTHSPNFQRKRCDVHCFDVMFPSISSHLDERPQLNQLRTLRNQSRLIEEDFNKYLMYVLDTTCSIDFNQVITKINYKKSLLSGTFANEAIEIFLNCIKKDPGLIYIPQPSGSLLSPLNHCRFNIKFIHLTNPKLSLLNPDLRIRILAKRQIEENSEDI